MTFRWNFYSSYVRTDAVDTRTGNSSTYRAANNVRTYCGSLGRERERKGTERKEPPDKKRKNETREEHRDWRATEAIVFRGNLQNVSFHRGPVPTELVCNSILSMTKRGKGGCERGGGNANAGECCVESRESIALAPVQTGSYRIWVFNLME